ncbi:hypothetical protein LRK24_12320 [Rhodanobacter denitrificans]|uniref:hypothetical protein n=1 Tax=Rhodanobacter denitrificans TaxID=666685 RepID=UPI000260FF45|nr:hypothetical protein [Rhodanobacter denitrificans]EIM00373.1 hypothetical protein UUC_14145 [Rhodanobacter denitrificans]UJM89225.1 hypothetical protein LRK24_12320 [Rhodanobacter denitrificans]
MLYILIAIIVLLGHDHIPGADAMAHQVNDFIQGVPIGPQSQEPDMGPLVAAIVATPYWLLMQMLMMAGKAGQGTPKGGEEE